METNGTKKSNGRFNIIDLVIIVIVAVCIAGVLLRRFSLKKADTGEVAEKASISFLVQNIRYTSADFFVGGDGVYCKDDGIKLGEFMKGFTITPAEEYVTDKNGKTMKVNYPENTRIDVRGSILSEGKWRDGSFFVDGNKYIAAGKVLAVQTAHITVTLLVTDVEAISDT